jgi:hypothetical protein
MAAPTYFGSASVPADGAAATNATTTLTITPPASMLVGDLVVVILHSRITTTWSVGLAGGQAWGAGNQPTGALLGGYSYSGNNCFCRIYFCVFSGTWSVNPRFDSSDGTCTTAVMHVFRPDTTTHKWNLDANLVATTYVAQTVVTCAGRTTVNANALTLACWHTADDNTWGTLTGTGWSVAGNAQYRNTAGNDQSSSYAYHSDATAGSVVPSTTMTQLTLGGDAGITALITFYPAANSAGSDNFNRANNVDIGFNWAECQSTGLIVNANQLYFTNFSAYEMAFWQTNRFKADQYIGFNIVSVTGAPLFYFFFRYTSFELPYYSLVFDTTGAGTITWYHCTAGDFNAATFTQIGTSAWPAAWTGYNMPLGITLEGAGNNTVIRIWVNTTGLPSATDNWNGDTTPDITFTQNPPVTKNVDTGEIVGLAVWGVSPADWRIDNWFCGDLAPAVAPTLPDPFTRSDSTDLGSTYDSGYSGESNAQIVSNTVRATTLNAETVESWNATAFTDDQYAQVKIAALTAPGSGSGSVLVGVLLRAAAPPTLTFYWCAVGIYSGGTYTVVKKKVAGTETQLLSASQTWAVNDTFRAEISGGDITILRNGSPVHTVPTDTSITSGRIGIYIYDDTLATLASGQIDDFDGGNLVAAAGQPMMRRWGGVPSMLGGQLIARSW